MKPAEYFEPLVKLGRRVRDKGREHGFALHTFAPIPTLEGDGPHHVSMTFLVVDEIMDEKAKTDSQTAQLAQSFERNDTKPDNAPADEARKRLSDLERRLRDPKKGILDD